MIFSPAAIDCVNPLGSAPGVDSEMCCTTCASLPVMQCSVLTCQLLQAAIGYFLLHLPFDVGSLAAPSAHISPCFALRILAPSSLPLGGTPGSFDPTIYNLDSTLWGHYSLHVA